MYSKIDTRRTSASCYWPRGYSCRSLFPSQDGGRTPSCWSPLSRFQILNSQSFLILITLPWGAIRLGTEPELFRLCTTNMSLFPHLIFLLVGGHIPVPLSAFLSSRLRVSSMSAASLQFVLTNMCHIICHPSQSTPHLSSLSLSWLTNPTRQESWGVLPS